MTYEQTQEYLFALRTLGSKFGLERMRAFYEAAGKPGSALPVIHVAGTNGKGSVCAMVEAILRAAGYKTGLFTSPHLLRLGERIQVNRTILSEAEIIAHVKALRPLCEQLANGDMQNHPTFFELIAVIALRQFEREGCDVAILETGLGGRLDATNIVAPTVTAITSIGLDHQELLGNSIEEIAAEKAGIVKPGVPLVLGRLPEAAEAVIVARANALGAPVIRAGDFFADEDGVPQSAAGATHPETDAHGGGKQPETDAHSGSKQPETNAHSGSSKRPYPHTALAGGFQRGNAAVALLICEQLCRRSSLRVATQTALQALRKVDWAGRWQQLMLEEGRELILDASHNEEGSRALEDNLSHYIAECGVQPIVVTGALGEPRARALLQVITRYTDAVCLVPVAQPRACSAAQLQALLPATYRGNVFLSSVEDLFPGGKTTGGPLADERYSKRPILVTGSIYLIGEIMTRLYEANALETRQLQDKLPV